MSAINERVSDLIHSEIADFFAGFGSPGEPDIQNGDAQKQLSARIDAILQQYRAAAEPIYQVFDESGGWFDIDKCDVSSEKVDGNQVRILYAAPQVTSVPEGYALVPVTATPAVLDEFDSIIDYGADDSEDAWSRLLAAARLAAPAVQAVPGQIDLLRAHYNYDGNDFEVRAYQRGWNDCVDAVAPAVQAEQLSGNTEQVIRQPSRNCPKCGGYGAYHCPQMLGTVECECTLLAAPKQEAE